MHGYAKAPGVLSVIGLFLLLERVMCRGKELLIWDASNICMFSC